MPVARAFLIAAALLAPAGAAAGEERAPPVVGKPGVYVVSTCGGVVGRGKSEAEARRAFERAVREAKRSTWPNMARYCGMTRLADAVRVAPGQRPAFFVAWDLTNGERREDVVRLCEEKRRAARKTKPSAYIDQVDCQDVRAVYGPFKRKPPRYDFQDDSEFLDDRGIWVDATGEPPCFPAGTAVATPDGDRPIETLAAGSRVLSWSADRGAAVPARVLDVKRRRAHELLELTLADGRTLRVSANHPLFVPAKNDYVAAGDLRAGAELGVLKEGRLAPVAIKQIATRAVDVDVFDLTVETTHSYFAGGVLAHNY